MYNRKSSLRKARQTNVSDKVELLRKIGIKISIIDKNEKYRDGYTLGSMKDDHPNLRMEI